MGCEALAGTFSYKTHVCSSYPGLISRAPASVRDNLIKSRSFDMLDPSVSNFQNGCSPSDVPGTNVFKSPSFLRKYFYLVSSPA